MQRIEADPWDVLVVGRGPAGLAAAIAVRGTGLSVAAAGSIDRSPRWGETLSASCLPLLSKLGIADELRSAKHLSQTAVRSRWGLSETDERSSMFYPYGENVILDRASFERRLENKLKDEGGIVIEGRLHNVTRTSKGELAVTLQSPSGIQNYRARALVDATGIGAHVARRLGGMRVTNIRQVAIGACFEAPPGTDLLATAVIESVPGGWLFAVPVATGRAVIWLVCDPAAAAGNDAHRSALGASQEVAQWLAKLKLRPSGEQVRRNASVGNLARAVGDGWLAVGDAAISLDPLSSSGLTLAMLSGLHGGSAIACSLLGHPDQTATYARLILDAAERHAALCQDLYRAEQRWPAADFWVSRRERSLHANHL